MWYYRWDTRIEARVDPVIIKNKRVGLMHRKNRHIQRIKKTESIILELYVNPRWQQLILEYVFLCTHFFTFFIVVLHNIDLLLF